MHSIEDDIDATAAILARLIKELKPHWDEETCFAVCRGFLEESGLDEENAAVLVEFLLAAQERGDDPLH